MANVQSVREQAGLGQPKQSVSVSTSSSTSAPIAEGSPIPDCEVWLVDPSSPEDQAKGTAVRTGEVFKAGKAVLVGVPGAFTPVCTSKHIPGYVRHVEKFLNRGISVFVTGVNDPFVMWHWGRALGANARTHGSIKFLADGNGQFNEALGLGYDMFGRGCGRRNRRYCLIVADGVVERVLLEDDPGDLKATDEGHVLQEAERLFEGQM